MSVFNIDAKKSRHAVVPCPEYPEESWRKTDPSLFFLPENEIISFQGKNIGETFSSFLPWKINQRDFDEFSSKQLAFFKSKFGEIAEEILFTEKSRIIFIDICDGVVEVQSHLNGKTKIEFSSVPMETNSVAPHSNIGLALGSRLKTSCPHEILAKVTTKSTEVPLIIVTNHLEAHFAQSYGAFKLVISHGSTADLIFIEEGAQFSYHRHTLVLEENSKLTQLWLNMAEARSDKTVLLERVVQVNENAKFDDVQIMISQGNTRVTSNIVSVGKKALINSAGTVLAVKGKFDYEPIQEHKLPEGNSNLSLKMILAGRTRCIFQGLVIADKEAVQTVANQSNKNLLLSKNARIDAAPRLEILPNEVKCKHGSATGEIDAKQLYYLSSRGFSEPEARALIVRAFAFETLTHINKEGGLFKLAEGALTCGLKSVLSLN